MDNDKQKLTFVRRVDTDPYIDDQTVTIGGGGGSDTVTDVPNTPSVALEIEFDGETYVILAYKRKE